MNPSADEQLKSALTEVVTLLWPVVALGLVALLATTAVSSLIFDESWLRAITPVFVTVVTMAMILTVRLNHLAGYEPGADDSVGGSDD